jgi:hypothetical protein
MPDVDKNIDKIKIQTHCVIIIIPSIVRMQFTYSHI